jgi:hypothetical protein
MCLLDCFTFIFYLNLIAASYFIFLKNFYLLSSIDEPSSITYGNSVG